MLRYRPSRSTAKADLLAHSRLSRAGFVAHTVARRSGVDVSTGMDDEERESLPRACAGASTSDRQFVKPKCQLRD